MFAHGMNFQKGEEGPLFSWRTLSCSDNVSSARQKTVLPCRLCLLPCRKTFRALLFSYTPTWAVASSAGIGMELLLEVLLQQKMGSLLSSKYTSTL